MSGLTYSKSQTVHFVCTCISVIITLNIYIDIRLSSLHYQITL